LGIWSGARIKEQENYDETNEDDGTKMRGKTGDKTKGKGKRKIRKRDEL